MASWASLPRTRWRAASSRCASSSTACRRRRPRLRQKAASRRRADLRRSGYGVGFGLIKSFGSPRGLDGIKLLYAVAADDGRQANIHVVVSGSALAMLGPDIDDTSLDEWILERPHRKTGAIAPSQDRYARLLEQHPISLSSLEATE